MSLSTGDDRLYGDGREALDREKCICGVGVMQGTACFALDVDRCIRERIIMWGAEGEEAGSPRVSSAEVDGRATSVAP